MATQVKMFITYSDQLGVATQLADSMYFEKSVTGETMVNIYIDEDNDYKINALQLISVENVMVEV